QASQDCSGLVLVLTLYAVPEVVRAEDVAELLADHVSLRSVDRCLPGCAAGHVALLVVLGVTRSRAQRAAKTAVGRDSVTGTSWEAGSPVARRGLVLVTPAAPLLHCSVIFAPGSGAVNASLGDVLRLKAAQAQGFQPQTAVMDKRYDGGIRSRAGA